MNVHENHFNAPAGATFTNVIYSDHGLMIDWVLMPREGASRPMSSRLLFDTSDVPVEAPSPAPDAVELAARLSERIAFFWMMVFPAVKAMLRGDTVRFHTLFDVVTRTRLDIEELLAGTRPAYQRSSAIQMMASEDELLWAIRQEVGRVAELAAIVEAAGGTTPRDPLDTVNVLLELASS